MTRTRLFGALVFIPLLLTPSFAHHLAVVVNKNNPMGEVSSAHLAKIFQSEIKKWPDGKDVVVVLHRSSNGEKVTLERLNRMSATQIETLITTHVGSIVLVDSDSDVLNTVETNPGAIGLVEVHSIDDHVKVIKVDGKLPLEDGYLPH